MSEIALITNQYQANDLSANHWPIVSRETLKNSSFGGFGALASFSYLTQFVFAQLRGQRILLAQPNSTPIALAQTHCLLIPGVSLGAEKQYPLRALLCTMLTRGVTLNLELVTDLQLPLKNLNHLKNIVLCVRL